MAGIPKLMVAPNGARKTKSDHPAVPVTIPELVETAIACQAAGAEALHAHVRDEDQKHVLDAGLYRELLAELGRAVPDMYVQITTEAVGQYSAAQQRDLVYDVQPAAASVAVKEMLSDGNTDEARRFYFWAKESGVELQHIVYEPADLKLFAGLLANDSLPGGHHELMLVLGRYSKTLESSPDDLIPYLETIEQLGLDCGWAVCAFGKAETDCLAAALARGGKARVGFENSLWNRDGSLATDNAERVAEIAALAEMQTG